MYRWTTAALWLLAMTLIGPLAFAQHTLTGELPKPAGTSTPREVVLVAGATGGTGVQLIEQLRAGGRYDVRAMARDPAAATKTHGTGYQWVAGDVTRPATLTAAMQGVTYVICAIGARARSGTDGPEFVDFGGVRNLTDAARAAGVRQLVLISSIGTGGEGGFTRWILNLVGGDVLVWKAKGEAYLRASGLPYTIVRPGGLRNDPGGKIGLRLMQGDTEMGDITRADTATVAIAVLGNPDALGKTFEVVSNESAPLDAWRSGFAGLKPDAR
jgi:uncharacterized protein YbjT (DUF2867 family)